MRQRIGDALVEKGLISGQDLEKAIQMQLIAGGTLGTNLMELGLVGEEDLGRTLGEQLRVRYASPETLRDIDPSTREALPGNLAQKHRAVPIRLEDRTLHILVADLGSLSGLSTKTGYRIIPWVAPEVRVYQALEKHFGVPGDARRAKIWRKLDEGNANPAEPGDTSAQGIAGNDGPDEAPFSPPTPQAFETGHESDESFGYGQSWQEIAERFEAADAPRPAPSNDVDLPPLEPRATNAPDSLIDRLCRSDTAEDVVAAVMDHAARQMKTCILFRVRQGTADIWDYRGLDLDSAARAAFSAPAHSGTPLELLTVYPVFRGTAPTEVPYTRFFAELGLAPPAEMMLLPVKIGDRLVAILYGDGGLMNGIAGTTEDHLEMAGKLALALNLVMIKRKIRS
jgi:hypothetical protein